MLRKVGLSLAIMLCVATNAMAVPVIFVGNWILKPNAVGNATWIPDTPPVLDDDGNEISPAVPAHFVDPNLGNVIQVLVRRSGATTETYDISDFVVEVLPNGPNQGPAISSLSMVAPTATIRTGNDGTVTTVSPNGLFFGTVANPGSVETLSGTLPSSKAVMVANTNTGTVNLTNTPRALGRIGFNTNGVAPGTYTVRLTQLAAPPSTTDFFNSGLTGSVPILPLGADPNDPLFSSTSTGTSTGALIYGTVTIIPEPSSIALVSLAGMGIGIAVFRRRKAN